MKRPTGVTIIGVLAIIAGVLYLLSSLPFFGIGSVLGFLGSGTISSVASGVGMTVGVISLVLGVLYLALGIGAMNLKSWAWTLGIVVAVIAAVFSVAGMFLFGIGFGNVITALLSIGVLVYLYTADVRAAFGHPSHGTSSHTPSMTA